MNMIYKTEDGMIRAITYIYDNADKITRVKMAEDLDIDPNVLQQLIGAMRKEGVNLPRVKSESMKRIAVKKWIAANNIPVTIK